MDQRKGKFGPEEERSSRKYTVEQEFFSKLPPEVAKQCRNVFSNSASRASDAARHQPSLLRQDGLQEHPVIMMLLEVIEKDRKSVV